MPLPSHWVASTKFTGGRGRWIRAASGLLVSRTFTNGDLHSPAVRCGHSRAAFIFFYLFTIEPVELLVAKSYYSIGLSVAKSSNILSVVKSWTVELSVAKDDVRRCLHITMVLLATVGLRRYNLYHCTPLSATPNQSLFKGCGVVSGQQLDQFS